MTDHHASSMHQLTHRRFDYPLGSCVPAELPSVSSNTQTLPTSSPNNQLNTGAMPAKIHTPGALNPNSIYHRILTKLDIYPLNTLSQFKTVALMNDPASQTHMSPPSGQIHPDRYH